MKLVILESPNKKNMVKSFLKNDSEWEVEASVGHVRDLPEDKFSPESEFGVNVEDGFKPTYVPVWDLPSNARKAANLKANGKKLADLVKRADEVYLCTDPDREGEAIAWHLKQLLRIPAAKIRRCTWAQEVESKVLEGIANPRDIDMDLFHAQQMRRILDRLVGYPLSAHLGTMLPQYRGKGSLSAGRVQSAVLKLMGDREGEIDAFVPEDFWTISAMLRKPDASPPFRARLTLVREGGKPVKASFADAASAEDARAALEAGEYRVSSMTVTPGQRKPLPPFSGSTLMGTAAKRLGFTERRTMDLAQALFTARDFDGELQGLITYHRTDSTSLSEEAEEDLRKHILDAYGPEYLPAAPTAYKTKAKNAQESHEAIRPSKAAYTPERVRGVLSGDELALYELIWRRSMACQMVPAEVDRSEVLVDNGPYVLKATGTTVRFRGFLDAYEDAEDEDSKKDESEDAVLPPLGEGDELHADDLRSERKSTRPPARYDSESLLKVATAAGVCRSSAWAGIIELLKGRNYIEIQKKRFVVTEKGRDVLAVLERDFGDVLDLGFTGRMEQDIEAVSGGEKVWNEVLAEFYPPFAETIKLRRQEALASQVDPDDPTCPTCDGGMRRVFKKDKKGNRTDEYFLSCIRYPDCRGSLNSDGTSGRPDRVEEVLEGKECPKCGGRLFKREGKGKESGRPYLFWGCENYRETGCDYSFFPEPEEVVYKDRACPECGGRLLKKSGKSKDTGKAYLFYGCENYRSETAKCRYSFNPKGATGIPCPKCGKGELVERKKKSGEPFWACDRGRDKCDGVAWNDPRPKKDATG